MPTRERKEQYFSKLESLTQEYSKAFIVHVDFVGSQQLQEMRMELRGQAEILMGKNTMIRKAIRGFMEERPELEALLPVMRGNVGFVFTNGDLADIRDKINSSKVPAAAKAGIIAPCDVTIAKGPSGLDPAQTSFFQALNIATKINKGSIEIINDVHLIKEGTKVGSSEAALLGKLGQKPFQYGLVIKHVYEAGALFDPSVLDIKDEDLMMSWGQGVANVAMMSLGANYPTHASVPHIINNAFKSILAICVEADYDIPQSEDVKKFLADPEAFMAAAASAAPSGGGGGAAKADTPAAAAPEPEPEEESDEDMGFGLFD